ncbi:MAG: redoxin domain-containing protein, partial [Chloroflexi bacterium]|nr:redoxin domain-containing protein [Chloroflexota bacterium]
MNRWHLVFGLILIFGGAWLWESQAPLLAQTVLHNPQPAIGYPAPDFTLTTLDGKTFNLRAHRGTPVVLNFWATWCGPCQEELPAVEATSARYANQVQVIGVDQAEAPDVVQSYV